MKGHDVGECVMIDPNEKLDEANEKFKQLPPDIQKQLIDKLYAEMFDKNQENAATQQQSATAGQDTNKQSSLSNSNTNDDDLNADSQSSMSNTASTAPKPKPSPSSSSGSKDDDEPDAQQSLSSSSSPLDVNSNMGQQADASPAPAGDDAGMGMDSMISSPSPGRPLSPMPSMAPPGMGSAGDTQSFASGAQSANAQKGMEFVEAHPEVAMGA